MPRRVVQDQAFTPTVSFAPTVKNVSRSNSLSRPERLKRASRTESAPSQPSQSKKRLYRTKTINPRPKRERAAFQPLKDRSVVLEGFAKASDSALVQNAVASLGADVYGASIGVPYFTDFIIVPLRYKPSQKAREGSEYVTSLWLDAITYHQEWLDPHSHVLFRPIAHKVCEALKGLTVSHTGLDVLQREFLRITVQIMGGKVCDSLIRNHVHYLVAEGQADGQVSAKFRAAMQWIAEERPSKKPNRSLSTDELSASLAKSSTKEEPIKALQVVSLDWLWHLLVTGDMQTDSQETIQTRSKMKNWLKVPPDMPQTPSLVKPLSGCVVEIALNLHPYRRGLSELIYYLGGRLYPSITDAKPTHLIAQFYNTCRGSVQDVPWPAKDNTVHLVSHIWLWECFENDARMNEEDFPVSLDFDKWIAES